MGTRLGARHGRSLVILMVMGLLAAMLPWGGGMAEEATPIAPAEQTESATQPEPTAPPDPTPPPPDPTAPLPDPTVQPVEPAQAQGMEIQSTEATTGTITLTIDPAAVAPASGYAMLQLAPMGEVLGYETLVGIETSTAIAWSDLPAGNYVVTVGIESYQPLVRTLSLGEGGDASISVSLGELVPFELETTVVIQGYRESDPPVWAFRFVDPATDMALPIAPFEANLVDGFGTLSLDGSDESSRTLLFQPAGPGVEGTQVFQVPLSDGREGTVHVVMGTYGWPGDTGAVVSASIYMPLLFDATGAVACLIAVADSDEHCSPLFGTQSAGDGYRRWDVYWADIPPGSYQLEYRDIPRHADMAAASIEILADVQEVRVEPSPFLVPSGFEPVDPEPDGADIEVNLDAGAVPNGAEVCLVNDETGEELPCQPAGDVAASGLTSINALRQSQTTATLVFENVPPGIWRVVLRVPDFHDVVIGGVQISTSGELTTTDASGQTVETIVVPPIDVDELEPTMADLKVISRFCGTPKSRAVTCSTRLPQVEGRTVTFTITGTNGTDETVQVTIGRQGKASQGSASITLPTRQTYTVCQVPVAGYTLSPSSCVDIYLDGEGAEVPVNNIKLAS